MSELPMCDADLELRVREILSSYGTTLPMDSQLSDLRDVFTYFILHSGITQEDLPLYMTITIGCASADRSKSCIIPGLGPVVGQISFRDYSQEWSRLMLRHLSY